MWLRSSPAARMMRDRLDLTEPDGFNGLLDDALPGVYISRDNLVIPVWPQGTLYSYRLEYSDTK